jgi:FkbM family methyltransferase
MWSLKKIKKFNSSETVKIDLRQTTTDEMRRAILATEDGSWLRVKFNGCMSIWPVETLRSMNHCIWNEDNGISVWIEDRHILQMGEWLKGDPGNSIFLDVGAATGAACIPIALISGEELEVIAFEPAVVAYKLLNETILKNNISNIKVFDLALSKTNGQTTFVEYNPDVERTIPYLPETSTIAFEGVSFSNARQRNVPTMNLDTFVSSQSLFENRKRVVVKIDIEGFEVEVLEGARVFIKNFKPFFSIDIHNFPGLQETTESKCREILSEFGYHFEKMDHVLLAIPVNFQS